MYPIAGMATGVMAASLLLYFLSNPEKKALTDSARQQDEGSYLRLSDGVTHYAIDGAGAAKRAVLLHGGTVPSWMWKDQSEALRRAGFQVLRYDMYGKGCSDRPDIRYDRATYRRQLLELVDKLGWDAPFDLVGHSFGGAVAISFAAAYPERVRRLVLISPIMKNYPVPRVFRPKGIGEIALRLFGIGSMKKRVSQWFAHHPKKTHLMSLFEQQMAYTGFQRAFLSMVRGDAFGDYSAAYQTVGQQKRDSLLIWGAQDSEVKREIIDAIRSCMPGLQLIEVENAGHGIVFEASEQVSRIVTDFLSRQSAGVDR